jgi:hypothetical protein
MVIALTFSSLFLSLIAKDITFMNLEKQFTTILKLRRSHWKKVISASLIPTG